VTELNIKIDEKTYQFLKKEAEKDGLTVDQEAQLALLLTFKAFNVENLEKLKKVTDPAVLRVFEKEYP
jgi:hypothetical protein